MNKTRTAPYLRILALCALAGVALLACSHLPHTKHSADVRSRILLDTGWRFYKYAEHETPDTLIYDLRPEVTESHDGKPADAEPTAAVKIDKPETHAVLKPWILPTANPFTSTPHTRPKGNPGANFPFVQNQFDDSHWQRVTLPHDWAISGPFYTGDNPKVGGGMGRLPSPGVGWYRKQIQIERAAGERVFLDIDGAMSYAMVWLNGHLVGGWPYGYASWQVDLTPYVKFGELNQLAIRVDNPPESSRWYPGGGLYRNVWLSQKQAVHIPKWGTHITTAQVSPNNATINISVDVHNTLASDETVTVQTHIYPIDNAKQTLLDLSASTPLVTKRLSAGGKTAVTLRANVPSPKLWGPKPTQTPNLYMAITTITQNDKMVDHVQTPFGIRTLRFDPKSGVYVNNEHVHIQGVNQHHDLGPLGAAFNVTAAKRQLTTLREMGVNAIRMAHNPPAPELLQLTDQMGFLVVNELFDVWARKKTPLDHHLLFPEWHEADLRAWIRRDRNHPSVILWSVGNEVGEQYTGEDGAKVAKRLHVIAKEEDPTRPTTNSMNYAKPPMTLPGVFDVISLNYQGEGIRDAEAYKGMKGIHTSPAYPKFKNAHPNKVIISSENAAAVSSRGTYLFPVSHYKSAPVKEGQGGNAQAQHVSAYELYTTPFGSSVDKVLTSLENHPYVAGGFAWSGWDYLGEPTPYYTARSSYFGSIDLAGFKKDRFYLYQSQWRPGLPMVHILPHWNWPEREGKVTPVHVFTSGDEVELFLNGQSLGKKQKSKGQFRLRWDTLKYQAGTLHAVAYKNGKYWAEKFVKTTGPAHAISLTSDKTHVTNDGKDLAFITAKLVDQEGQVVPTAQHQLTFTIQGPGELVAADNGDPSDLTAFTNPTRNAFNGLCLAIVRPTPGATKPITLTASSADGLVAGSVTIALKATVPIITEYK